jgi:alkylation response protein AidB-like acyl-CoA dehydrogenase
VVYELAKHHEAVRTAVREFGENEIRPVASEYNQDKRYPEDLARKAAEYDFVGPRIPETYGGAGMDDVSACLVTEELWRADPGVGGSISARGFGTELLMDHGEEWMKEEWLPRIAAGESAIATAISEPAHGSDVAAIETRAERDGDEWIVNGQKTWITNGSVADIVLLMAKTDPDAGQNGISVFLVPTDRPGFTANTIDNKLGIEASDLAELILDDVRVSVDNLVGEENEGFFHLMEFFPSARVNVAAQSIGVSQAALDAAQAYATEREQFDQPIADFQAVAHMLAEIDTRNEAARSLTYRTAEKLGSGDRSEINRLASMAKLFASERAVENCDDALQVFGGAGYVSDHPVERYYRDARITKIYDGTSEIQKNVIADQIL